MDLQFNNFVDRVRYGLRDFTSVGSKSSFNIPVLTDESLYKMNPQRYSFYMQLLDALQDPKSEVLDRILSVEAKTRFARENMENRLQNISKNLRFLQLQFQKDLKKKEGGGEQRGGVQSKAQIDALKKEAEAAIKPVLDLQDSLKGIVTKITDLKATEDPTDLSAIKRKKEVISGELNAWKTKHSKETVTEIITKALADIDKVEGQLDGMREAMKSDMSQFQGAVSGFISGLPPISSAINNPLDGFKSENYFEDTNKHVKIDAIRTLQQKCNAEIIPYIYKSLREKISAPIAKKTPEEIEKQVEAEAKKLKTELDGHLQILENVIAGDSILNALETELQSYKAIIQGNNNDLLLNVSMVLSLDAPIPIPITGLDKQQLNMSLDMGFDFPYAGIDKIIKFKDVNNRKATIDVNASIEDGKISTIAASEFVTALNTELVKPQPGATLIKQLLFKIASITPSSPISLQASGGSTKHNYNVTVKPLDDVTITVNELVPGSKYGFEQKRVQFTILFEYVPPPAPPAVPPAPAPAPVPAAAPAPVPAPSAAPPPPPPLFNVPVTLTITIPDVYMGLAKTLQDIEEVATGDIEKVLDELPAPTETQLNRAISNNFVGILQNEVSGLIGPNHEIVSTAANQQKGGGNNEEEGSFYQKKLDEIRKAKNITDSETKQKRLEEIIDEVDTHPIYNPEFEKVSMTDRIIFIAVTFIVRSLSLFLIDWGLNSHMINTFNRAFLMYIVIYLCIFLLWALLVNAGEDGQNLFFRMLFYYVNWDAHGPGRVLVHCLVQLMLLPVPFLVKERVITSSNVWTFEERRATFRVLSNFTFFIWLLTSVIALRY